MVGDGVVDDGCECVDVGLGVLFYVGYFGILFDGGVVGFEDDC